MVWHKFDVRVTISLSKTDLQVQRLAPTRATTHTSSVVRKRLPSPWYQPPHRGHDTPNCLHGRHFENQRSHLRLLLWHHLCSSLHQCRNYWWLQCIFVACCSFSKRSTVLSKPIPTSVTPSVSPPPTRGSAARSPSSDSGRAQRDLSHHERCIGRPGARAPDRRCPQSKLADEQQRRECPGHATNTSNWHESAFSRHLELRCPFGPCSSLSCWASQTTSRASWDRSCKMTFRLGANEGRDSHGGSWRRKGVGLKCQGASRFLAAPVSLSTSAGRRVPF